MHKIALLGAGRIGKIHARNVLNHPGLTLSHVVDPVAEPAQAVARESGAEVASIEEVLADASVNGIIIATSTDTHLDFCLRAHAAGKAIFCEKPIDLDLARARSAVEALKGARLFLGFNRRFDQNFRTLRAKLVNGEVGRLETLQITSNDPAPPPVAYVKTSGGLFKDMAIHDFDMARWLLDEEPMEIFAWGSCLVDPGIGDAGDIDTARTVLRTRSGKLCVIANSRRSGFGYDQRVEAYGSAGMVCADNVTVSSVRLWSEAGVHADRFQNFFLDRYEEAYRAEMHHFAEILADSAEPLVGYADGLAALALAEAASHSIKIGQPVRL